MLQRGLIKRGKNVMGPAPGSRRLLVVDDLHVGQDGHRNGAEGGVSGGVKVGF